MSARTRFGTSAPAEVLSSRLSYLIIRVIQRCSINLALAPRPDAAPPHTARRRTWASMRCASMPAHSGATSTGRGASTFTDATSRR